MTSPQDVVTAARRGEGAALAALYRGHGVAAFRLAYHLTGTPEDAEDVVHDVFVGLPEALRRYEQRCRLGSWVKRGAAGGRADVAASAAPVVGDADVLREPVARRRPARPRRLALRGLWPLPGARVRDVGPTRPAPGPAVPRPVRRSAGAD